MPDDMQELPGKVLMDEQEFHGGVAPWMPSGGRVRRTPV
jgi:hypothetical protein